MLVGRNERRMAARRPGPDRHRRGVGEGRGVGRLHRRGRLRTGAARSRHAALGLRRPRRAVRAHPRIRPRPTSSARCSRASPSGVPTWSRRSRPTATCRWDRSGSTEGCRRTRFFTQRLADATQRPVEVCPVREATTLGAGFLAGLAVGTWGGWDDLASSWTPGPGHRARSAHGPRSLGGGGPSDRAAGTRTCPASTSESTLRLRSPVVARRTCATLNLPVSRPGDRGAFGH